MFNKKNDSIKILIVEDSKDNQLLIQAFFKKTHYEIETAENGIIAFDKFKKSKYDVILMDIQMPVMDGYTATHLIRQWENDKKLKPTIIIALTAFNLESDITKSLKAGCNTHITKPIRKPKLLQVIGDQIITIMKNN